MANTKAFYAVVMATRKTIGNGYDFKRKYYRNLGSAVKYYFNYFNDYDNIYIVDELSGAFIMEKRK